jgi:hypothetical protein
MNLRTIKVNMKNLLVGLVILLGGCSSVPSVADESVTESSSPFEQGITIGQVACGDWSSVSPTKEIRLQVQESAEKYLPEFLEAAEVWNLKVLSVEVLNDSAPYNPARMLLSTCLDSNRQDIVLGRWDMGGFQISHQDILDSVSADLRLAIFIHELGHNQGLLDSSENGIMNSAAVYGGVREPSESERAMVEAYWKGKLNVRIYGEVGRCVGGLLFRFCLLGRAIELSDEECSISRGSHCAGTI